MSSVQIGRRPLWWFVVSLAVSFVVIFFPELDLYISSLFVRNNTFYLANHPLLEWIHNSVPYITITLVLLLTTLLGYSFFKRKIPFQLTQRKVIYLFLALIVGPGFIVNTVFKDQWGRARPYQVVEFGGTKTFTPAFKISDQCQHNCSFVSGDPSVGFYFFSFVLVYRMRFLWVPLLLGSTFGITRIMQGSHFFSDVIFSGMVTLWSCYLLYYVLEEISYFKSNITFKS